MKEKEAIKLYNSITNIDLDYIEEADKFQKTVTIKFPTWLKFGAISACICLIASMILFSNDKIYYPEKPDKNTAISCEWKRSFDNLQEFYENSDLIVYADVIENPINIEKGHGFVKTKIKINEVLKGNISAKEIFVYEDGQINNDGTDYSVEGIPLLRKNMKVVLFLFKNYELESNSPVYHVLTPLPGKFLLDKDRRIHHSSELTINGNFAEAEFKQFSGKTYNEFKKDILGLEK